MTDKLYRKRPVSDSTENQETEENLEVETEENLEVETEENLEESTEVEPKDEQPEDDAEEVAVSLGEQETREEEEEKRAPEWVRDLRKGNREKDRKIRELESKLAAKESVNPPALGQKPTLEGCDYDAEKFDNELQDWYKRKIDADRIESEKQRAEESMRIQWETRINAVKTAASSLKVRDYDEASQVFEDTFSPVQQGIIIGGPDDPKSSALLRYALGHNHKKAKELAAIADPVKFAFAVAKLETQMKVTPKKSAPPPDKQVKSSLTGAAAIDNHLEKLRDEAQKTGDMSKVLAYKNSLRSKQRA